MSEVSVPSKLDPNEERILEGAAVEIAVAIDPSATAIFQWSVTKSMQPVAKLIFNKTHKFFNAAPKF
jgi:hypothetical protein